MLIARTFVVPITEVGQATSEAERHRLAESLSLEMIGESHTYWLTSFLDTGTKHYEFDRGQELHFDRKYSSFVADYSPSSQSMQDLAT